MASLNVEMTTFQILLRGETKACNPAPLHLPKDHNVANQEKASTSQFPTMKCMNKPEFPGMAFPSYKVGQ